jgi:hypothetical protein
MEEFYTNGEERGLDSDFELFQKAAAAGHKKAIWIGTVAKDVPKVVDAMKEAFAKTEDPLGWYLAATLSPWLSRESFELCKKSAEAGCSWGQTSYAHFFRFGVKGVVNKDEKAHSDLLFQAANQKNPEAMYEFGDWFYRKKRFDQAILYYRGGAELGWKKCMWNFSNMLRKGEGCAKDLRRAAFWDAKGGGTNGFAVVVREARIALDVGKTEDLKCDFNQLCYTLGWGLYWHRLCIGHEAKAFVARCLDYYCSCVELQQKSIFTFLMCWNRTTAGVKGPGQMIAKMVWKGKKNHLVKPFEK